MQPIAARKNTSDALSKLTATLELHVSKPSHQTNNPDEDHRLLALLQAHAASPAGHPDRKIVSEKLAPLLDSRCKKRADELSLEACIEIETELLGLHPPGHPRRARRCINLALPLKLYYDRTGNLHSLDEAVGLNREALSLCPAGHPGRARACTVLAITLVTRFKHTGDAALLDEAIGLHQQALGLRPPGHPDRAISCDGLATLHRLRYHVVGDVALLHEGVRLHREALALRPTGDPRRAQSCDGLANTLTDRFIQTGEGGLPYEAVLLYRESLSLRPPGHRHRAISCNNLGMLLHLLVIQTGDTELLEESICLLREALTLQPPTHPGYGTACMNLAISLSDCRKPGEDGEIIELGRSALARRPEGHPDRLQLCTAFATLLYNCSMRIGDPRPLDEALLLQSEVLSAQPAEHPYRGVVYTYTAQMLLDRFSRFGGDQSMLDDVESLVSEGLTLCPPGNSGRWRCWASLVHLSLIRGDHAAAIQYLNDVLDSPDYDIRLMLDTALRFIDRLDGEISAYEHMQALLSCFASLLEVAILVVGLAADSSVQLRQLLDCGPIGPRVFILAMRANNLPVGLQLLERARGIIWSLTIPIRHSSLDGVPSKLAQKLRSALPTRTSPHVHHPAADLPLVPNREAILMQRSRLQEVLREIRALPGLSSFMRGSDQHILVTTAANNPVVILVAVEGNCRALIIASPEAPLVDLPLEGLDDETLKSLTFTKLGSAPQMRGSMSDERHRGIDISKPASSFQTALAKLWRTIVKPIIMQLGISKQKGQNRSRIHWCPTGTLTFVPIHAAGVYKGPGQECSSDYVVSSYAPTLTALLRAQQDANAFNVADTNLTLVTAESSVVADGLPRLWHVAREASHIIGVATAAGVPPASMAQPTKKAELLACLPSANILHIACHGVQHATEPHKSHFCLSDGRLTVTELMEMDFKDACFAFLSACETAKGDRQYADEAVHLASTMLFAGFKSIVATMWAMNDRDGPFVTKVFYEHLFKSGTINVATIAYALDHAVTALRETGASPERWATFIHMGA